MSHNFYQYKRNLIDRKNRAAEDLRMNAAELSWWPLFWVSIAAVAFSFFISPN